MSEEQAIYDEFLGKETAYDQQATQILNLSRKNQDEQALVLARNSKAAFDAMGDVLDRDTVFNREHSADAAEDVNSLIRYGLGIVGLLSLLLITSCIAIADVLRSSIVGAIGSLTRAMKEIAAGNWDTKLPLLDRGDELGEVSRAVEVFTAEAAKTGHRAKTLNGLIKSFEMISEQIVGTVASAASDLQVSARTLASNSSDTASKAKNVTTATEQASVNVRLVADAGSSLPRRSARSASRFRRQRRWRPMQWRSSTPPTLRSDNSPKLDGHQWRGRLDRKHC